MPTKLLSPRRFLRSMIRAVVFEVQSKTLSTSFKLVRSSLFLLSVTRDGRIGRAFEASLTSNEF